MARTTQLRTACDSCSVAKVRCDKIHPACGRCVETNMLCCYSASRKHGRQSWRKRLAQESEKLGLADTLLPPAAILPKQAPWESLLHATSTLEVEQSLAGPIFELQQVMDSQHNELEEAGADFVEDHLVDSYNAEPFLASSDRNINYQTSSYDDTLFKGRQDEASANAPAVTNSSHGCEARAISILSSLQHGSMHRGLASCSVDPAHPYPDLDLAPAFDRVIAVNKTALGDWSEFMKCSCAKCPHMIMLYVSILSKALFWYRVAAIDIGSSEGPGSHGPGQRPEENSLESPPEEAPTVDKFHVRPSSIKVGGFIPDNASQAELLRMILLRELQTTEKAIQSLMEVDRDPLIQKSDESVRRMVQWSLGGISHLTEDLRALIDILRGNQSQVQISTWAESRSHKGY